MIYIGTYLESVEGVGRAEEAVKAAARARFNLRYGCIIHI